MGTEEPESLPERLARLEKRVALLEAAAAESGEEEPSGEVAAAGGSARGPAGGEGAGHAPARSEGGPFWALEGLKQRAGESGAVLFTGAVRLPTGEFYEWQEGHPAGELLADDWAPHASVLAALAHPVRLLLLREVLNGARTTAELSGHEQLGTTGQLYHHLRQLVSAGWLRTSARGHYAVPGERVLPLLVVLAAVRR